MGDTDSLSENGVQCNISGKLDNSSMYLFYSRLLPWLAQASGQRTHQGSIPRGGILLGRLRDLFL
jgi:hypothetical protein